MEFHNHTLQEIFVNIFVVYLLSYCFLLEQPQHWANKNLFAVQNFCHFRSGVCAAGQQQLLWQRLAFPISTDCMCM